MPENVSSCPDDPNADVDDGNLFDLDEATPPEDPRASTLTDGRDQEVTLEEPIPDDGEFAGVFHQNCVPMNFRKSDDASNTTGIFSPDAGLIALKLGRIPGRTRFALAALGLN